MEQGARWCKARPTIVIKVPREDDECDAQCFGVACEEAMTGMVFWTGIFSLCLYHSSEPGEFLYRDMVNTLWC